MTSTKIRCSVCNIKTGIDYYECKCDLTKKFCMTHKFGYMHDCKLDQLSINKERLNKLNIKVDHTKLEKI